MVVSNTPLTLHVKPSVIGSNGGIIKSRHNSCGLGSFTQATWKGKERKREVWLPWLRPARQKAMEQHCLGTKSYDTGAQEITQIVHCLGQHQNPSASLQGQKTDEGESWGKMDKREGDSRRSTKNLKQILEIHLMSSPLCYYQCHCSLCFEDDWGAK